VPDLQALNPYFAEIDKNRYYSNFGPLVKKLEERLAARFQPHIQTPVHVVTTSSATLGLELALASLDLPKGARVLVPALTFVATLTAVIHAGYVPVVTDIDAQNWLLTPEIAEQAIKETQAQVILAVATFGQPQDTKAWARLQEKLGVHVIIDAAGAFGSQWIEATNIPVVFSMHATKSLVAGEGGFVVCGNQKSASLIRELSNFGINLDTSAQLPVGHLSDVGTNAKLSEFHAAVGLASLDNWDAQAADRSRIHAEYRNILDALCGHVLTWQAGIELAAPNTLCVRVGSSEKRVRLEEICIKQEIGTRRWYQPLLHQHAKKITPIIHLDTTTAELIATDLIGLPFSPFITTEQIEYIADTVYKAIY
jgi:dTDP-4-amino-4,6-dideoxygalactose transaminase